MISSTPASLEAYWTQFDVDDRDLEFIYNLLLEREVPLTTAEMAVALVEQRMHRLEEEVAQAEPLAAAAYLPAETYETGVRLIFPALSGRTGVVIGIRQGQNPEIGPFQVMHVSFDDGDKREFAMELEEHVLNGPPEISDGGLGLNDRDIVMVQFQTAIESRIVERLRGTEDIVWIAGRWFPKALLAEIHVGHLNLAEAVLDVAAGVPLQY